MNIDYTDVRTQEMILNLLHLGEVKVTFTKADGTNREMRCSLNSELLPVREVKDDESKPRKKSVDTVAVYDLDKLDWCSFRWDSIIEVVA